jgi:hypothetical protein
MFKKLFSKEDYESRKEKYLFVIGYNKTGTTSVHRLFQQNGLMSVHWDEGKLTKIMLENVMNDRPVFHGYHHKFDVMSDMFFRNKGFFFEGVTLYKQMDHDYPNAYFLYNTRDIDSWLESRKNHPNLVEGMTLFELHKKMLRTDDDNVVLQHWKSSRLNFEQELRDYFRGRSNFLEMDITDENFVEKLNCWGDFNLDPSYWGRHNET